MIIEVVENTVNKNENEHVLIALKKDPKSFKPKEIKAEIRKLNDHEQLYNISKSILPKLNITNQTINYYASLTEHYPIRDYEKTVINKQRGFMYCVMHNFDTKNK